MKFNTSDLNPGVWFDDGQGGELCVRVCNIDILQRVRKDTRKVELKVVEGRPYEMSQTDTSKEDRLIWDYCIVDWKGMTYEDGTPIPCTADNKILLMSQSIGFSTFFTECIDKLGKTMIASRTDELKNSTTSQIG